MQALKWCFVIRVVMAIGRHDLGCPAKVNPLKTSSNDTHLRIEWTLPVNPFIDPIDKCEIELKMPDGSFSEICDCTAKIQGEQSCEMPHRYLYHEKGLPACFPVRVRLRARNKMCWNQWSNFNSDSTKVHGCPQQLTLAATTFSESSITVGWFADGESGCAPVSQYHVQFKKEGGFWRDLSSSTETQAEISDLQCSNTYLVRARTEYPACTGAYSTPLSVSTSECINTNSFVPGPVRDIKTEQNSEKVTLKWRPPSTNGDDIITYIIMIRSYEDTFRAVTDYCDDSVNTLQCIFPSPMLQQSPFSLTPGSQVVAKVTAYNSFGLGKSVQTSIGAVAGIRLTPPEVSVHECVLKISWKEEVTGVQVEGRNGFHNLDCQKVQQSCFVSMQQLTKFPFLLKDGDDVSIRMVKNGAFSPPSLSTPLLKTLPATLNPPTLVAINQTAAVLSWQGKMSSDYYDLQWNDNQDSPFHNSKQTRDSTVTVTLAPSTRVIQFKLRAKNECGFGEFSRLLPVYQKGQAIGGPPRQMSSAIVTTTDCKVKIEWQGQNDLGILRYDVQVNGQSLPQCGKGAGARSCSVPVLFLERRMATQKPLRVKVAAVNGHGVGEYSTETLEYYWSAAQVSNVHIHRMSVDEAVVRWNRVFENTNQRKYYYEVEWDHTNHLGALERMMVKTSNNQYHVAASVAEGTSFQVRAITPCGVGPFVRLREPFNEDQSVQLSAAQPFPSMQAPTLSHEKCSIIISWKPLQNVETYCVEVRGEDMVAFHSLDNLCEKSIGISSCKVPMKKLQEAPFYLHAGDEIITRIYSLTQQNERGGAVSAESDGVKLLTIPSQIATLTHQDKTRSSVNLLWSKSNIPDSRYEVEWDDGAGGSMLYLATTDQNSYEVNHEFNKDSYKFKVRAINQCGKGPFSSELTLLGEGLAVPGQIKEVRVKIEQCNVRISWEPSDDNGSPIKKFLVSIKQSEEEDFHSLSGLCGRVTLSRSCVVPLTILAASPFNLKYGDLIRVHVAAKNANGWGLPSPSIGYTVAMPMVPVAMEKPRVQSQDETAVVFSWETSLEIDNSIFYELFLSNEAEGDFTKISKTTSSFHKIQFEQDTDTIYYKFKVRSVSTCGFGPFSKPVTFMYTLPKSSLPVKMQPPSTMKVGCDLKIHWHAPPVSSPVKYILELKDRQGVFHTLKDLCIAKSLDSCQMPMNTLKSHPFSLVKDDLIQARITAENRKGQGEFSETNTMGVQMDGPPSQVTGMKIDKKSSTHAYITWNAAFPVNWYEVWVKQDATFNRIAQTQTNRFTMNFDRSKIYKLKVRAYNKCGGFSEYSRPFALQEIQMEVPAKIQVVQTQPEECGIRLYWYMTEAGPLVTKYAIEVKARNAELYQRIEEICDNQAVNNQQIKACFIPFASLSLQGNDLALVRILAGNNEGWSQPSPDSLTEVNFKPLTPVSGLKLSTSDSQKIVLMWNKQQNDRQSTYEVYMKSNQQFQKVQESTQNFFTFEKKNIDQGQLYQFKVHVRNNCVSSQVSETIDYIEKAEATETPEQVKNLLVSIPPRSCALSLTWDTTLATDSYTVQFLKKNKGWYILQCSHSSPTTCSISIGELSKIIKKNELVYFRVAAKNDKGIGPYSEKKPFQMVSNRPNPVLKAPWLVPAASKQILRWHGLSTEQAGGLPIQQYELMWNYGIKDKEAIYRLGNSKKPERALINLNMKKYYKFRVKARNQCGESNASPVLVVDKKNSKGKDNKNGGETELNQTLANNTLISVKQLNNQRMRPVETVLTQCQVKFDWVAPIHNELDDVRSYKLEVRSHNGTFHQMNDCGKGHDVFCIVDMQKLQQPPLSLKNRDLVVARVSSPAHGIVDPSKVNTGGAHIVSKPDQPAFIETVAEGNQILLSWNKVFTAFNYELYLVIDNGKFKKITETNKTKFKVKIMANGGIYKFKVRAKSMCGIGQFSDIRQVTMDNSSPPQAVTNFQMNSSQCHVNIAWEQPKNNGGFPVTAYRFELQTNRGNFSQIHLDDCQKMNMTCTLPMKILQEKPYNLPVAKLIKVRITAYNKLGWGEPLIQGSSAGQIQTIPAKMTEPQVEKLAFGNVRIRWDHPDRFGAGNKPIITYDLVWDGGDPNSSVNIRLVDTVSPFYILRDLDVKKRYRVAVRAHNKCGYGKFSDTVNIDLRMRPSKMATVRTSKAQNCGMLFSWFPPADGGSPITGYIFQVKDSDGILMPLPICGKTVGHEYCAVSMETLTSAPFNLRQGSLVEVTAYAVNAFGSGDESELNTHGMKIAAVPGVMEPPKLVSFTQNSITLKWEKFQSQQQEGNRKIIQYNLEWYSDDKNETNKNSQIFEKGQREQMILGLSPGLNYRFRIQAKNICGGGPFSTQVAFRTTGCPSAPATPSVALRGTDVLVQWEEPAQINATATPITEYLVLFLTKEGQLAELKEFCNGKDPKIVKRRACLVPMNKIQYQTGLGLGQLIQVQVRARNQYCPGQFSKRNIIGQVVEGCPRKMDPVTIENDEIYRNSVTIHWKTLTGIETGGTGVKITQFQVRMKEFNKKYFHLKDSWTTNNLEFTQTGLKNEAKYIYQIRAFNKYCIGKWSDSTHIVTGLLPKRPGAPDVSIVLRKSLAPPYHQVQLNWIAPPNQIQDEILGYKVYVESSHQEFLELKTCDYTNKTTCVFQMSALWVGPFRLKEGSFIRVRVSASNLKGEGGKSPVNKDFVKVEHTPAKLSTPRGKLDPEKNQIALEWELLSQTDGSPILSYNLQSLTEPDQQWVDLISTTDKHYRDIRTSTERVSYRLRASNRWGFGPWSWPYLQFEKLDPPGRVNTPETTIEPQSGDLKIEWEVPNGNGLKVSNYTIQVLTVHKLWNSTSHCNLKTKSIYRSNFNSTHLFCRVPMLTLTDSFGLKFDELVKIRISASSYAGSGPWSHLNEIGAHVRQKPLKMKRPFENGSIKLQGQFQNSIFIEWNKLTTANETGNSYIFEYVLMNEVSPGKFKEIYTGLDAAHILYRPKQGSEYKFRVAARNVYGFGPKSDALVVRTGSPPGKMQPVRSKNEGNSVIKITWRQPVTNGYPVLNYQLVFYDKSRQQFKEVPAICDGSERRTYLTKSCQVSSALLLSRGYGYRSGDLLIAKVRAQNRWGWGGWSVPNTDGATIFKLVPFGQD